MQCLKLVVALAVLVSTSLAFKHGERVLPDQPLSSPAFDPDFTTSIVFVDVIPAITTSTVFATYEVTVTSCPSYVTDCPTVSGTVFTSFVPISTTVCPVTLTSSYTSDITTPWYPTVTPVSIPSVPALSYPTSTVLPWAPGASSSSTANPILPPTPTSPVAGTVSLATTGAGFSSFSLVWPSGYFSFTLPSTIVYTHSDTITLGEPTTFVTTTSTSMLSVAYPSDYTSSLPLTPVFSGVTSGFPVSGYTPYLPTPSLTSELPASTVSPSGAGPSSLSASSATGFSSGFLPSTGAPYSGTTSGLPTAASSSLTVPSSPLPFVSSGLPVVNGSMSIPVVSYTPVTIVSVDTLTSSLATPSAYTGDSSAAPMFTTDNLGSSVWLTPTVSPYVPVTPAATGATTPTSNALGTTAAPVTTGTGNMSSVGFTPTATPSVFQGAGTKHLAGASIANLILAVVAALF